jgi:hypothetical protein
VLKILHFRIVSGWFWIQQGQSPKTDQAKHGRSDSAQFFESQHDSTGSRSGESENFQIDRNFLPRISGWLSILAANYGKNKLFKNSCFILIVLFDRGSVSP